jgi:hypothetical protein
MVDQFYHFRHVLWIVNLTEDTVLIKSSWISAKLVLEHSQRFTVNLNCGIRVGEEMGMGPEWIADIQGNEIGQLNILGCIISSHHHDLLQAREGWPD